MQGNAPAIALCFALYRGRFTISELLTVTEAVQEQIQARANASQILRTAMKSGMKQMRDDGIQKILEGQTTIDEVLRVTIGQID